MCFKIFTRRITETIVIGQVSGIDEDEALFNLAVGDSLGGFDGMMHAFFLNESDPGETIFLVYYDDGTAEIKQVKNGSALYNKYVSYL